MLASSHFARALAAVAFIVSSAACASAVTNGAVLPSLAVPAGGVDLPLTGFLPVASFQGQAVRVLSSEGPFNMELLTGAAPKTVANFLRYVDAGAYRSLFVHRSVPGFVIQTGGLTAPPLDYVAPAFGKLTNEFGISNSRGTVAMAKVGGDPDSATCQWFVNLADNHDLDTNNGGFTVFARVLGGGMSNVDRIASLPVYDKSGILPDLGEWPLRNYQTNKDVSMSNLVVISNVLRLPGATSSDEYAFTAGVTNGKLRIRFRAFPLRPVSVSVQALDGSTNPWSVSIPLLPPGRNYTGVLSRSNGTAPALASLAVAPTGLFTGSLANGAGTAKMSSLLLAQKFVFTNADTGVFFSSLGESAVYWYDHTDAVIRALNYSYTNAGGGFTNTLSGALLPSAYSGASNDACPLAGKTINAVLTRTNESPRPVYGFLQLSFDKAGVVKIAGQLPDGRSGGCVSSVVLDPSSGGTSVPVALFARQSQPASLSGFPVLALPVSTTSPVSGSLEWLVGSNRASFNLLDAGVWSSGRGTNAITGQTNTANCRLEIPGVASRTVSWGPGNRPLVGLPGGVTFKFDASTGAFSGSVASVNASGKKVTMPFKGVVFPAVPAGMETGLRGCGLLTSTSGVVAVKLLYP